VITAQTARLVESSTTADRLVGFRCSGRKLDGRACGKLLLEMHEDAIRAGKFVRVKCKDCNALNSFTGTNAI
jgi:phage FluMu protein Com